MPIPFIPIAAAIGGAGVGWVIKELIGGAAPTKKDLEMVTQVPVTPETRVSVYAPQTTSSMQYAPTTSEVYAPQVSYAPQVVIGSPGAQLTTKKELRSEVTSEAYGYPSQAVTPTLEPYTTVPITTEVAPKAGQMDMAIGGDLMTLLLLGAVGVGAIVLLKE